MVLALLLLTAVGYVHVFQKMVDENLITVVIYDGNDDAEESSEKPSEENPRETDKDEDPLKLNDLLAISFRSTPFGLQNHYYSHSFSGYFPEIVSPPPQN